MSEETFGALQFSSHFLADLRRSSFKVSPAAVQPRLRIRQSPISHNNRISPRS
jgi:hypothetical protein